MGIVTTIAPFALVYNVSSSASLTVKDFTRVFQHPKEFCRIDLSISSSSNCWLINYYFKNSS